MKCVCCGKEQEIIFSCQHCPLKFCLQCLKHLKFVEEVYFGKNENLLTFCPECRKRKWKHKFTPYCTDNEEVIKMILKAVDDCEEP